MESLHPSFFKLMGFHDGFLDLMSTLDVFSKLQFPRENLSFLRLAFISCCTCHIFSLFGTIFPSEPSNQVALYFIFNPLNLCLIYTLYQHGLYSYLQIPDVNLAFSQFNINAQTTLETSHGQIIL